MLVAEGLATREPNRGVSVASPEADSVRDVCAARLVLEGAGIRRWREADRGAAGAGARARWTAYIAAIGAEASYQELNERHLAFHVSLVGLTGSPRLVAMQENLVVELKLALAQVDRIRRNAHDQADSHAALVRLLERDDIDGGVRVPGAGTSPTPRTTIIEALEPVRGHDLTDCGVVRFLTWLVTTAVALAVAAWLSTASASPGRPRSGRDQHKLVPLLLVALIFGVVTSFVKPILTSCRSRSSSSRSACSCWSSTRGLLMLTGWLADKLDIGFHGRRLLAGGRRRHRHHGGHLDRRRS